MVLSIQRAALIMADVVLPGPRRPPRCRRVRVDQGMRRAAFFRRQATHAFDRDRQERCWEEAEEERPAYPLLLLLLRPLLGCSRRRRQCCRENQ